MNEAFKDCVMFCFCHLVDSRRPPQSLVAALRSFPAEEQLGYPLCFDFYLEISMTQLHHCLICPIFV
jgi:hypothetical protein